MKNFEYTIKDDLGIHARPAGLLVKLTKNYESEISVTKEDRTVDAKKLMAVMSLGVARGNTVIIQAEGTDETEAIAAVEKFFEENL